MCSGVFRIGRIVGKAMGLGTEVPRRGLKTNGSFTTQFNHVRYRTKLRRYYGGTQRPYPTMPLRPQNSRHVYKIIVVRSTNHAVTSTTSSDDANKHAQRV